MDAKRHYLWTLVNSIGVLGAVLYANWQQCGPVRPRPNGIAIHSDDGNYGVEMEADSNLASITLIGPGRAPLAKLRSGQMIGTSLFLYPQPKNRDALDVPGIVLHVDKDGRGIISTRHSN